jgi:hypothetical protein
MPQRASVFCNFYIRVDREALVSDRALDVGSVAFKAMSTKKTISRTRCFYFYFVAETSGNCIVKLVFDVTLNKMDVSSH